jgi:hypothetical protein
VKTVPDASGTGAFMPARPAMTKAQFLNAGILMRLPGRLLQGRLTGDKKSLHG